MSTPNRQDIADAVAAQHPDLVKANTRAAAGLLTEHIVGALHAVDAGFGLLSKTPAENQFNGHAVDATIYQATQQVVDLMSGAGDREELANIRAQRQPTQREIDMFDHDIRIHWLEAVKRPDNNWMAPVTPGGGPAQPPPVDPPPPAIDLSGLYTRIALLEAKLSALDSHVTVIDGDLHVADGALGVLRSRVDDLERRPGHQPQTIRTEPAGVSFLRHTHEVKLP